MKGPPHLEAGRRVEIRMDAHAHRRGASGVKLVTGKLWLHDTPSCPFALGPAGVLRSSGTRTPAGGASLKRSQLVDSDLFETFIIEPSRL